MAIGAIGPSSEYANLQLDDYADRYRHRAAQYGWYPNILSKLIGNFQLDDYAN